MMSFFGLFVIGINLLLTAASDDVLALRAFKEAIYEDPHLALSNWNTLDSDPCNWRGVYCSPTYNHIITLNLSGLSLKGFLSPELGRLSSLQELYAFFHHILIKLCPCDCIQIFSVTNRSGHQMKLFCRVLNKNNLLGTISKEIGMLKNLEVLDLGMNQLSGPIPPEIGNLVSATTINLQSNGLTGNIPPEFGSLINLIELRLDRNKLDGSIPAEKSSSSNSMRGMNTLGPTIGFCHLSSLKTADFSFNFFTGRIPECLNYLPRSSFLGNCFQDKNPKQRSAQQCGVNPPEKNHSATTTYIEHPEKVAKPHRASKPGWILTVEIVAGIVAAFLVFLGILMVLINFKGKSLFTLPWRKEAMEKDQMIIYIEPELMKDVKRWNRQELEVACEDFSNIIGSSADTPVYKGVLKDGLEIAVISLCIKEENWSGHLEFYFQKEVAELARINHENTAKLLGHCRESAPFSRMLVFQYASNGTLYEHLHYGDGCQLSWARRMRIISGTARGLKYLHTELDPPFTVYELNSSAIYLTEDFSPKLVDFESWKTVYARLRKGTDSDLNKSVICGLPDSVEARHVDVEANLYAFGVLLLEIISGRPPYCKDRGCLVDWAKEYLESPEVMSYLVDPELCHFRHDDLKVICEVVNICLRSEPAKRSSMDVMCPMLENRIEMSMSAERRESPLAWAELVLST